MKRKDNTDFGNFEEPAINLTAAELDEKLDSPDQVAIRNMVHDLGDEAVSLQWRSDLNERLRSAAVSQKRKNRLIWIWKPALGLGLASVLAVTFLINRTPQQAAQIKPQSASLEAALLQVHRENVSSDDVAGPGLNAAEVDQDTDGAGSDSGAGS